MNSSILLDQISRDDLITIITKIVQANIKPDPSQLANEFITRKDTARKLGLSLPTLNEYTKTGIIPAYRIGSRVRYKSNEIETALLRIQSVKGKRV